MDDTGLRIYAVRYDGGEWREVIAPDPDTAQQLTEPPRTPDGRRSWRHAVLGDVTPVPPDHCPVRWP